MATSTIRGMRRINYSSGTRYVPGGTVTITKSQVLVGYVSTYDNNGGVFKVDGTTVLAINVANPGYAANIPVWLELSPGQVLSSTGNFNVANLFRYDIV